VLAPVHDTDDGWAGARCDLHEVELGVGRLLSGFFQGDDTDLLAVGVDESDGADADVVVYASLRSADFLPPLSLCVRV
jgi:hypothetical protein